MEALGLEVCEAQNIMKTLHPSQETQTQMQDIIEQQAAVTSITTPAHSTATTAAVQPITNLDEYTLLQDLHNFIQTTGKLNTQYHTDDYILTIQQSSTGERMLSIGQKSAAASNEPMTQLTAQEILNILNAPPETSTSLQTFPGTDMIAVPTRSQPTEPQPSTSGEGQFLTGTPPLPIPPPSILEHVNDLLKKHKASKVKPHREPTEEPSASGESSKKEEDVEYIVEEDDNEDDDDDDDDNDDDVLDEDKPQYVKKRCGKPVPVELQNPEILLTVTFVYLWKLLYDYVITFFNSL